MNLELCEKINTTYLAGKAEVMRMAAEGRQVVCKPSGFHCEFQLCFSPRWDWSTETYGILKQGANNFSEQLIEVAINLEGCRSSVLFNSSAIISSCASRLRSIAREMD